MGLQDGPGIGDQRGGVSTSSVDPMFPSGAGVCVLTRETHISASEMVAAFFSVCQSQDSSLEIGSLNKCMEFHSLFSFGLLLSSWDSAV